MSLLHWTFYSSAFDVFAAGANYLTGVFQGVKTMRFTGYQIRAVWRKVQRYPTKDLQQIPSSLRRVGWGIVGEENSTISKKIGTISQHIDSKSLPALQTKINFLSGSPCTAALAVACGHSPWITTVNITALCCMYQHYIPLLHTRISTLQPSVGHINIATLCCAYQHYSPLLHISTLQPSVAYTNITALCFTYQHYSPLLHISTLQPYVAYINITTLCYIRGVVNKISDWWLKTQKGLL